ncbi:MAG: haloacid dehalogenase type II [Proteobacteria bacterium]|nr:haloacid dehalogenase type II [Pseudomonadota bacterium]
MTSYLFDAYGTLFDVHSAIAREGKALGEKAAAISALWRAKQLEYSWVLSAMAASEGVDFETLTARGLDFALAAHGVADDALRARLLSAYDHLDAYPDVREALVRLKQASHRTAVFTNGTRRMVEKAIAAAKLGDLIDTIITVEPCGAFKPVEAVYAHALAQSGARLAGDVRFVSSNRWDVAGGVRFGFTTYWINRAGMPDEYPTQAPAQILGSLSELPI